MVDKIILDGHPIVINEYKAEIKNGFNFVYVEFHVSSEEYHAVTTLLYAGEFKVQVPADNKAFKGKIIEYSTSISNLYESGQVGTFKLALLEEKE